MHFGAHGREVKSRFQARKEPLNRLGTRACFLPEGKNGSNFTKAYKEDINREAIHRSIVQSSPISLP